jgi:hypothetical protein
MADTLNVVQESDTYWQLGCSFVEIQTMELNDALIHCGVADADLRKRICQRFGFGMGNFLDQYWLWIEDRTYYPLLMFSESFLDVGDPVDELGLVQLRSPDFEFHGVADDTAEEFFTKQGEKLRRATIGCVGEEAT